eukprot:1159250-Pelagomonas_calceolata.AAC.1
MQQRKRKIYENGVHPNHYLKKGVIPGANTVKPAHCYKTTKKVVSQRNLGNNVLCMLCEYEPHASGQPGYWASNNRLYSHLSFHFLVCHTVASGT